MSNNQQFNLNELAIVFKALSNPNRLQIFQRLLCCCVPEDICAAEEISGFCVGELGENLAVAPSTLSHHIKELQHAGLIKTRRKGKNIECFVEPDKVKILNHFFSSFMHDSETKK